jgi:toxin secretion/phage lysis holin
MKDFTVELVWAKLQIAFTAVGGWLGYYLGGLDGLLTTLVVFVVLDYLTGVMCAVADKTLSSAVGFRGLFCKVLIFALVGVGHVVDTHVIGNGGALRSAVICFYLSNEGLSMIENAARLGLPVPDKLKGILAQLHGREGNDDE